MSHTIFGGVDVSTSLLRTASGGFVRTSGGNIVQVGGGAPNIQNNTGGGGGRARTRNPEVTQNTQTVRRTVRLLPDLRSRLVFFKAEALKPNTIEQS